MPDTVDDPYQAVSRTLAVEGHVIDSSDPGAGSIITEAISSHGRGIRSRLVINVGDADVLIVPQYRIPGLTGWGPATRESEELAFEDGVAFALALGWGDPSYR